MVGGSLQTHVRLSQGENAAQDVDLFLLQATAGKEAPKPLHHSGGVTFGFRKPISTSVCSICV
jgi:hypothetical protein